MYFSDPKYPNLIRIRYGSEIFLVILQVLELKIWTDPNPTKSDPQRTRKNYKYLYGSNFQDPKDLDPKIRPKPDLKIRMSKPTYTHIFYINIVYKMT